MEMLNVLVKAAHIYWSFFWKSVSMFGFANRDTKDWIGDFFFLSFKGVMRQASG